MSIIHLEEQDLPDVAPHNHGRTVAGWVTNAGISVGALILAIGVAITTAPVIWAGIAVCIVSLVAGGIMRALGHGQSLR